MRFFFLFPKENLHLLLLPSAAAEMRGTLWNGADWASHEFLSAVEQLCAARLKELGAELFTRDFFINTHQAAEESNEQEVGET